MPVLVLVKEENMTIKCETLRAKDWSPGPGAEERERRQTSGQPVLGTVCRLCVGKEMVV